MNIHRFLGICIPLLLCLGTGAAAQTDQKPATTVLLITTDIAVAADGSNVQTTHVEVRAGNDAGALQVGQASLPFDSTGQDIAVVEAHTLKPDGETLPVDASAIYDQAPPGQSALLVTGLRAKLIVFPQFSAGDTAVYTVKITTRHPNFTNQFLYSDVFPRTQAFNEVRETITAPKTYPLYVESHDVEASKRDDGTNVKYSWHYSAPKPIAEEPVTMSPLDHTPRLFVSSFKDYAQLGQAYAALAEPKRVVTPKIQALADDVTKGVSDPKAQARQLYEWVSAHIRYVGIELGTGSFVPHDVDSIVANGYGDCKDHDILLQALLKAKGIEARSILLNSGGLYTLTEVATFTTLDHVITFLPQFNLYLDSTAATAPFGVLPLEEYGKPMVVASATASSLGRVPVLQPGIGKVEIKTVSALDKNGILTGTTTTTASGPYAIALRMVGLQIQSAGPNAATQLLKAMGYENASGTFSLELPIGFAPSYTISGTFKYSGWEDNLSGKNSFFMPPGPRLFGQSGDHVMGPFNPGSMSPSEPTACLSAEQSEDLSLKAPVGYQFDGLPNDMRVETPNLLFVAHWSLSDNTLTVHRDFTSKIDQPLCTGTIRAQSAAALKRISDSYDVNISFAKQNEGGVDKTSSTAQSFYNSGFSHLKAMQYELAIADFDKAVALKPDEYVFVKDRGLAYLGFNQYASAIADFDRAIKLKQDDYWVYRSRAVAQEDLNQHDLAIADYGKAIALAPEEASLYSERGQVFMRLRQVEPGIADFSKAIALDPDGPNAPEAYLFRGLALILSHSKLASADLNKAIALRPDFEDAYRFRAGLEADGQKFQEAIADFDKAIALKPDDVQALADRGRTYVALGQAKRAIADYDTALALKPDDVAILSRRGFAHKSAKEYALAIADFDRVIALKPDFADAYLNRGDAKTKMGKRKEGDADIAAAIKLDPSLAK